MVGILAAHGSPVTSFSTAQSKHSAARLQASQAIRFGYVRLLDAAPIVMAENLGYFSELGLRVSLERELGWATIRDRIVFGELDVAQALSPMPLAMRLGIGVARSETIAGMALSRNGNAITLSESLWANGASYGSQFKKRSPHSRKHVFGTVSRASSHYFMLCRWLESGGIDPQEDVIITVLPPEQLYRNLAMGNIDGFCVGEPWNSLAISQGIGWSPITSDALMPGYPEKLLIANERLQAYKPDAFAALIVALEKACQFCAAPENATYIANTLASGKYLNCPADLLRPCLEGQFDMGHGNVRQSPHFIRFHGEGINAPTEACGKQALSDMQRYLGLNLTSREAAALARKTFREDLFHEALNLKTNQHAYA